MSTQDKFDAAADQVKGTAKEVVGDATGDDGLAAEGKADQLRGQVKEAAEKVKDTAEDVVEKAKDAVENTAEKIRDAFKK
ncbi:uncharacterized protein YjbJ (UPF0337 family) [Microbacterium resistens]|uniref:Uncharacterized protein YjbJ (UPF0337 family) n=1 Tax=Microbacterium resistens TaxID=156977 RepID=A0ABU1SEK0_9MICO|nr:CsbD family protein [Microbacterium resistens]MDR6868011.1 uncharacterized protein YjbJ (UPF0337 family) [Microbacterium resistens]